jgi:L,D-transpeptidase ErfK/SrfK
VSKGSFRLRARSIARAGALLLLGAALTPRPAWAQALAFGGPGMAPPLAAAPPTRPTLHSAARYIVIRLAENRLHLMEGDRSVWSAPVATGGGFRLEGGGRSWHFTTPQGVFRLQRKEKDPIWVKPDWAFIRDGLPVPPLNSPLRRQEGMLGNTALYIGYELAIHGTDKPELVLRPDPEERRVSHGCIRMTNEDVRALYHLVDVGTPVLIY